MKLNEIVDNLMHLDKYELLGAQKEKSGEGSLTQGEYLYFLRNGYHSVSLKQLQTPQACNSHAKLQKYFQEKNEQGGLTAEDCFADNHNIEIQKIPRHILLGEHIHQFTTCFYVLTGSAQVNIDDNDYSLINGDFIYIPSGHSHELFPKDDSIVFSIQIRHPYFGQFDIPDRYNYVSPLMYHCKDDTFMSDMILRMYEQQLQFFIYSDEIMMHFLQLILFRCSQVHHNNIEIMKYGNAAYGRIREIVAYMIDNYSVITLRSLADHFGYNPAYLSNLLHQNMGYTFSQILMVFRIYHAVDMLQHTDMKLNEICENIGYSDVSRFIKNFKRYYYITPSAYRRIYRKAIAENRLADIPMPDLTKVDL